MRSGTPAWPLAALLVLGCTHARPVAPVRDPASRGARAVKDVVAELRGPVVPCESRECLEEAFARCEPSRWADSEMTLVDTPVWRDFLVELTGAGCRLLVIEDHTADFQGRCAFTRQECASFEAAFQDDREGHGCEPKLVLFEAEPCRAEQPAR